MRAKRRYWICDEMRNCNGHFSFSIEKLWQISSFLAHCEIIDKFQFFVLDSFVLRFFDFFFKSFEIESFENVRQAQPLLFINLEFWPFCDLINYVYVARFNAMLQILNQIWITKSSDSFVKFNEEKSLPCGRSMGESIPINSCIKQLWFFSDSRYTCMICFFIQKRK